MGKSKQTRTTTMASSKQKAAKPENGPKRDSKQETPKPKPKLKPKIPRMLVFQPILETFAFAGVTPALVTQAYPLNAKIVMGFLLLNAGGISNLIFALCYAHTFAEYTQTIYVYSLVNLIVFALLIVIFKVEDLFIFVKNSADIINTNLKYSPTRSSYLEANLLEEKISKIVLFVMIRMTPTLTVGMRFIYSFLLYFLTDLRNDALELTSPMWFPFDWKNPFGFLIAMATQYIMLSYITMIGGSVLVLAIGTFVYMMTASRCIKSCLFAVGRNAELKANRIHILEQLIEFIQYHSRVKQLISLFSDIFQPFITILFMWSLITICGALLMIQMQIANHSDNLTVLLITTIEIIYAFGILLVACEMGQRNGVAFEDCSQMIDQFKWYLFPNEPQRVLPIIMSFTQQPIVIKCFGSMAADRETFKYVVNSAFSYFTLLRQFYN